MDQCNKENRRCSLVFENVCVSILNGKERKSILTGVSGNVVAGEVLGIMGPSGSGKTTLLNVLSNRIDPAKTKLENGCVTIDGKSVTKRLKRKMGYVLQEDILFTKLTVRHSIEFAAQLRLPKAFSHNEKISKVDQLIEDLGLEKCQTTNIGGGLFDSGISGGEKKRVSIGVELITGPPLLFMDEPTTGLDSSSAARLISLVKKLASEQKKTIICTLHQPSSQIFYSFDKLLLLSEGRTAYFGPTKNVTEYFADIGLPCRPDWNPADDIIEKLTGCPEKAKRICDEFEERNPTTFNNTCSLEELRIETPPTEDQEWGCSTRGLFPSDRENKDKEFDEAKWESSFVTQVKVLTYRAYLQSRGILLDKWNLIQTLVIAIITSVLWLQIPLTEQALEDRLGLIFFSSTYWMFQSLFATLLAFPEERPVISKERASGMYRLSSYYIAKTVSEFPVVVFQPIFFWTVVYWATGLQASMAYLSSMMVLLLESILFQSIGLLISAAVTDLKEAIVVTLIYSLSTSLVGGYFVKTLPSWLLWLEYFSFTLYAHIAMVRIEFTGSERYRCKTTSEFVSCALHNATHVSGDEILKNLNFTFELWECIVALLLSLVIVRILCYFALRMNKSY